MPSRWRPIPGSVGPRSRGTRGDRGRGGRRLAGGLAANQGREPREPVTGPVSGGTWARAPGFGSEQGTCILSGHIGFLPFVVTVSSQNAASSALCKSQIRRRWDRLGGPHNTSKPEWLCFLLECARSLVPQQLGSPRSSRARWGWGWGGGGRAREHSRCRVGHAGTPSPAPGRPAIHSRFPLEGFSSFHTSCSGHRPSHTRETREAERRRQFLS